jgi:predicted dehydrogenase
MLFRSLVVGFGYSGSQLHVPALHRLAERRGLPVAVAAVDPRLANADRGVGTPIFESIGAAAPYAHEAAVVHVCTPPTIHAATVAEGAALGFRRFVVEKPMVTTERDLETILTLEERYGLDILVVSNWLSSALTERLLAELDTRPRSEVRALAVRQVKPRIARSLANGSHTSVFEVELPHQVALARLLVAEPLTVVDGYCGHLEADETRVDNMGVAEVALRSKSVPYVLLYSDLMAPHRERSVLISWADGSRTCGFYPCDRADHYAQLMHFGRDRHLLERSFIEDESFDRCLEQAYAYFEGRGERPRSDVAFHTEVCGLLAEAQTVCGVEPVHVSEPELEAVR